MGFFSLGISLRHNRIFFNDDASTVYIDNFEFDTGDKFTYEYNFFKYIMHDIRIEDIKNSSTTNNNITCISGSGMPGATKYDEMDVKLKMIKKIIKNGGKLSYEDICDFQKKIKRIVFIKNVYQ